MLIWTYEGNQVFGAYHFQVDTLDALFSYQLDLIVNLLQFQILSCTF